MQVFSLRFRLPSSFRFWSTCSIDPRACPVFFWCGHMFVHFCCLWWDRMIICVYKASVFSFHTLAHTHWLTHALTKSHTQAQTHTRHRNTRCEESANIDSHALKHTHSCKTTSVSHTHVHNSPRTSITSLISELPRTCSATAALCTYSFWTPRQNEFTQTQHTSETSRMHCITMCTYSFWIHHVKSDLHKHVTIKGYCACATSLFRCISCYYAYASGI